MFHLKKVDVWASEIAEYLNKVLVGEDFVLTDPRFIRTGESLTHPLHGYSGSEGTTLVISNYPVKTDQCGAYILSDRPDLDVAYVLREFFCYAPTNEIHRTAIISEKAKVGRNVLVGAHSIIDENVEIGDSTQIFNNVMINGPATIGKSCVIKDGAVIGSEGWSFLNDEQGIPVHVPQLGHVVLGDRVWIGSNSTVERAMIEDTIIGSDVKVDDIVHIGAGSIVGEKSELTAGVVVASHVRIGRSVRIAPNATVRENVSIGDNVLVGQGSVVISDLSQGDVYVGNPARVLRGKRRDDNE